MPGRRQDIHLRSEEVEEILSAVPHWMIRWGNVLFLSIILGFLGISWLIKYPDVIASEVVITTQKPPHKEYAKVTGQLQGLLVSNGDAVVFGQPLGVIENTARYADVYRLKSAIDTIRFQHGSFHFPIDSTTALALGEMAPFYAEFENSYLQYFINSELKPYSTEAMANRHSLSVLNDRLHKMKQQKWLNEQELDYQKKDLVRSEELFTQNVIAEQQLEKSKLSFLRAERNLQSTDIAISQLHEVINQAVKTSKTIEIGKIEKELTLLRRVIQSAHRLQEKIKEWELRYVLKSEINGSVFFLNHWHQNQTVNQGDLVFTIVPDENNAYVARLKTPARNLGKIGRFQDVHISLESYPQEEFGLLKGKVESISMVPDEDGLYLVEASLPEALLTSYNRQLEFKQEMQGTAEIVTSDLRLAERFFNRFKQALVN